MTRPTTAFEFSSSSGRVAVCVLLLMPWVACGERERQGAVRNNLILVTIDTLRADHLGCYGYPRDTSPHIDRLARESVLLENVIVPMATTLPSHTSLLTGLEPLEHGILANVRHGGLPFSRRPQVRSLAEFAQEEGFATAAFISAGAPLGLHSGLDRGFDVYSAPADGAVEPGAVAVTGALEWLDSTSGRPFVLWVHAFEPHWTYRPAPEHDLFEHTPDLEAWLEEREIPERVMRQKRPNVTREVVADYDGEVHAIDAEVGRLLDGLRARGLLETSVFVLTSDHGEGLNQHDWHGHERVHREQVHVPCLIRFPSGGPRPPGHVEGLVSFLDVLPTVLPWVDARLARRFALQNGRRGLFDEGHLERPVLSLRSDHRRGVDEPGPMYALTTQAWRYLHLPEGSDRLYRLDTDPHELHNLIDEEPAIATQLKAQLLEEMASQSRRAERFGTVDPDGASALSPEVLRQLDALGY